MIEIISISMDYIRSKFYSYTLKFIGQDLYKHPTVDPMHEVCKSLIDSFTTMLILSSVQAYWLDTSYSDVYIVYGSFGATVVLLQIAYKSPLSQPWNVLMGHILSAFIGVSVRLFCVHVIIIPAFIQQALAVSLAIFTMMIFDCVHPPGGASSLIAIVGGSEVHAMGYYFVLYVGSGALLLLLNSIVLTNLWHTRKYPLYWHYYRSDDPIDWDFSNIQKWKTWLLAQYIANINSNNANKTDANVGIITTKMTCNHNDNKRAVNHIKRFNISNDYIDIQENIDNGDIVIGEDIV